MTAAPGQNVLISCAIAGDPFPTVHWFKDGQEILPGKGCEILQNEDIFTLILRNVQSRHAGQYEIQLRYVCCEVYSIGVISYIYPQAEVLT